LLSRIPAFAFGACRSANELDRCALPDGWTGRGNRGVTAHCSEKAGPPCGSL
jgi:hypothetical protein